MTVQDIITRNFLRLLRAGIFGCEEQIEPVSAWKWKRIYKLSVVHGVSALTFDGLQKCKQQFFQQLPDSLWQEWEKCTHEIEARNHTIDLQVTSLFDLFNKQQLRPILVGKQSMVALYNEPAHHIPCTIDIFFPFETQGHKADLWARNNGTKVNAQEKFKLSYEWNDVSIQHQHILFSLTNKWLDRQLKSVIEQEIRESTPVSQIKGSTPIETLPPTLSLLHLLLQLARQIMNDGLSLNIVADLALFLRKEGDKVDYVKLQDWIEKLRLSKMAHLIASILIELLGFETDETPFMQAKRNADLSRIIKELLQPYYTQKSDWYFQQADNILVHASNSSAMFRQVRHTASFFSYYPAESVTNLFAAFAHSLSHIEE